jgi:general secretion pathway protein B
MSFILDALRKSEHARQRQTGPALVETPVAAPRAKSNLWPTAAIALLVVNLVAIGLLLLSRSGRDEADEGVPTVAAPATAPVAPGAQASVTRTLPEPASNPPPMLRPAEAAPPAPGTRNPLEGEVSEGALAMNDEAAAVAAAPRPQFEAPGPARPGSVVYESAPGAEATALPGEPRSAASRPSLPLADEFVTRAGLPEMRLELHVYSARAQDRFVFINGRKYREGESTQEGATVEEVTTDGVVLNARGSRFLLPRD